MIAAQTMVSRIGRLVFVEIYEFGFDYACDVSDVPRVKSMLRRDLAIPKYVKRQALKQLEECETEIYEDVFSDLEQCEINAAADCFSTFVLSGCVLGLAFLVWWTLYV